MFKHPHIHIRRALILAITASALLTPAAQAGGDTARPIHGTGAGTIRFDTATGEFTGEESGVISHLGKYTLRLQGSGSQGADGTVSGSGTVTMVAANGDRLTGTFTLFGDGQTQTVVVTITGGTGRFSNASGTLTVICVLSGPPRTEGQVLILEHTCTTKGEIDY